MTENCGGSWLLGDACGRCIRCFVANPDRARATIIISYLAEAEEALLSSAPCEDVLPLVRAASRAAADIKASRCK